MSADMIGGLAAFLYFSFGLGVGVAMLKDVDAPKDAADGLVLLIVLIGVFWPGIFGYWAANYVKKRMAHPEASGATPTLGETK